VRQEIEAHVAMWADHLAERGMPRDAAEREARARFGSYDSALRTLYTSAQQREKHMRRREWWDTLRQDIVFCLRLARREAAFTVVALLTFALGIGANTAIYSVVHGVLLRPLPFAQPDRLAAIWPTRAISNAELEYMQRNARTFSSVAMFSPGWGVAMTNAGEPRQLDAARTSTNFFSTLGVRPALGRTFAPDESQPGKWDVAIISHELWTTHFNADPSIIGRVASMDGQPHRIIGVMPAGFEAFLSRVEAWMPLQIDPTSQYYTGQIGMGFGRLAGGATLATANTEITTFIPRMREAFNYTDGYGRGVSIVDLHESFVGDSRQTLLVLLGAVVLLVLIAAANVGNLLVVHAVGRERELTIRRALGASRGRLARQLLVQGVLLAVVGGTLGVIGGAVGLRGLKAILPHTLPMVQSASIDLRVLAFCALFTLGAGVVLGLAPALLATKVDPDGVLRAGIAARGRKTAAITRKSLVVVEVAVAMMLVVGAGLMAETLWRLSRVDLGFDTRGALTFRLQPSSGQLDSPDKVDAYFTAMTSRLAAEPGVSAVGAAQHLPLSGFNWQGNLEIETQPAAAKAELPHVPWRSVTGDYFGAMRIPLLRGRAFASTDTRAAPPVVIINNTMAKKFWPNVDPIGQRIKLGNATRREWATIVGVVGDVRFNSPDQPPGPEAYRPNAQQSLVFMHYVLRTRGDPLALLPRVRDAIRSLDKTVPIGEVRALDDLLASTVRTRRTVAQLLMSFAALGLLLGAVGIYGIISFGVSQRTRELGIRSALGALEGRIVTMVLGEGVRLAAVGILVGAVGAIAGGRSLRTLVYGVDTNDPWLFGGVALALGAVAVLASWIPARRASRVDPLTALRGD
jgi:predicted permease